MAKHYVGIADPKLICVVLEDRDEFDLIGLDATDAGENERGGHVLFKSIEANGVRVVFQHWITIRVCAPGSMKQVYCRARSAARSVFAWCQRARD